MDATCSSCTSSFPAADDPRFASTVAAVERTCAAGSSCFATAARTISASGERFPWSALLYIDALSTLGRKEEARTLFEAYSPAAIATGFCPSTSIRAAANCGEISADLQHGGMINSAMRLSIPWDEAY